jgi:uncharacterized membrane protein YdfJ with MMPL/SSD domain
MIRLGRFSIAHPVKALAVWGVLALVLAAIGLGVSDRLSPTIVVVPGSETARAVHLAESNFGPSVLVPVLLEGPKRELDQQGPALVKALAARRDTRVLSAWDIGETGARLRPDAMHAMLVASVAQTEEAMVEGVQQDIDRIVDQEISEPVTPFITGTPTIDLLLGRWSWWPTVAASSAANYGRHAVGAPMAARHLGRTFRAIPKRRSFP